MDFYGLKNYLTDQIWFQSRHGWFRAVVQGRQDGGGTRLRLRPAIVLALHDDGVLAYRRDEPRRIRRMAGAAGLFQGQLD
jgi:hypothetical protein